MADKFTNVRESLRLKSSYKKKVSLRKYRGGSKGALRSIRRKRSRNRYYNSLKQLRYNRKTDDLCAAVEVFDISEMDWAPTCSSSSMPAEVIEWQKQDQIAYWKSRAISLEFENRMLHEQIRNVYAKTIEDYSKNRENCQCKFKKKNQMGITDEPKCMETTRETNINTRNTDDPRQKNHVKIKEPVGKNRIEEMKKIYGDESQKIMGMETALQLNYERNINQLKPSYWPSIPLCLSFD